MALIADRLKPCVRFFSVTLFIAALSACGGSAWVSWEQSDRLRPHYQIKSGDTLYSVAWGYGLDFRRLAAVNDLHPPYPLFPGQLLRLPKGVEGKPRTRHSKAVVKNTPNTRKPAIPQPKQTITPAKQKATPPKQTVATSKPTASPKITTKPPSQGRWLWPHKGRLVKNWGAKKHQKSGLDIAATPGQAVRAAASGVVVYAGNGLARYGQLVIIKHSEELLSAYAYNQSLLVKKGQQIKAGSKLALSGRSPDGAGLVHFEIRKHGKPVDALQYLDVNRG